jgi:hypothetical protein
MPKLFYPKHRERNTIVEIAFEAPHTDPRNLHKKGALGADGKVTEEAARDGASLAKTGDRLFFGSIALSG